MDELNKIKEIINQHTINCKLDEFGVLILAFVSLSVSFAIIKDKAILKMLLHSGLLKEINDERERTKIS